MLARVAWKLIVRAGPRVERSRFERVEEALDALESRARELAGAAQKRTIDVKVRTFEAAQQVSARLELAGPERFLPSVRAGLDVRGDGTTEAYTGRVRRQLLDLRRDETTYRALRRAVTDRPR
jgi:hypothetical protein